MPEALRVVVVTKPPVEPVTLAEAKARLRIESGVTEDDALITGLIQSARETCERFTGRALIQQSLRVALDAWPRRSVAAMAEGVATGVLVESAARFIELPRPPLDSLTQVKLYDENDTATTWAPADYFVDNTSEPGRLVLRSGKSWPSATRAANAIEIEFIAGYAPDESASPTDYRVNLPQALIEGVLRLVVHRYEHRGDTAVGADGGAGAEALWRPYRVLRL